MPVIPVKPKVVIEGDRDDSIMALTGWIKGYQQNDFVLWCFGFLPDTLQSAAYGVSIERYVWVLAKEDGTVIMQFKSTEKEALRRIH